MTGFLLGEIELSERPAFLDDKFSFGGEAQLVGSI